MAQADHLPIFKASYDLCLHLEQVVERFSRSHPRAGERDPRQRTPGAWPRGARQLA